MKLFNRANFQGKTLRRSLMFGLPALGIVLVAAGIFLWQRELPRLWNDEILRSLRKDLHLKHLEMDVRQIGVKKVEAVRVLLEDHTGGILSADRLEMTLTPGWSVETGQIFARIRTVKISGGTVRAAFRSGKWKIDGLDWTGGTKAEKLVEHPDVSFENLQLTLDWEGANRELRASGKFQPSRKQIEFLLEKDRERLRGTLKYDAGDGRFELRAEGAAVLPGLETFGPAEIRLDSHFWTSQEDLRGTGELHAWFQPEKAAPVTNGWRLTRPLPANQKFDFKYHYSDRMLYVVGNGSAERPGIRNDGWKTELASNRDARWKFVLSGTAATNGRWALPEFDGSLENVDGKMFGAVFHAPAIRVNRLEEGLVFSARDADATLASGWNGSRAELFLPLEPTAANPGFLKIAEIRRGEAELGQFDGKFYRSGDGAVRIDGKIQSRLLPGKTFSMQGEWLDFPNPWRGRKLEFTLPPGEFTIPELWKKWLPGGGTPQLSGILSGQAALLTGGDGVPRWNGQLVFSDGKLHLPSRRILANQLSLTLSGGDAEGGGAFLLSAHLRAGNVAFGGTGRNFRNFDISADREKDGGYAVRGVAAQFAGGEIFLRPFRYSGNATFSSKLYCENLRLAELLAVLRLGSGKSSGTLSGILNLEFSGEGIRLKSGELHSEPGRDFPLRLTESEALLAGGTNGNTTDQEFAMEALRNFSCRWATARWENIQGKPNVKFTFSGHPVDALPFDYESGGGRLFRKPSAKTYFQAVELDIASPFDEEIFRWTPAPVQERKRK